MNLPRCAAPTARRCTWWPARRGTPRARSSPPSGSPLPPAAGGAGGAPLAAAGRRDGHVTPSAAVEVALLESVANGVTLNPSQAQLVRELATSGAQVQLALAPAGTGKTTALRALATAWRVGGGEVVGLAPSPAGAPGPAGAGGGGPP